MSPKPSPSSFFVERFLTVDTRALGVFRIAFGLLLLGNLYDRIGGVNFLSFYTNAGVLPNHYALFLPPAPGYWSLLLGFSSPWECRVAFTFVVAIYVLYTLGWHTRWMQVLALVAYESVNNRFILIQHGGNVVMNIMAVWTLFLPLGARYSLDALLASLRRHVGADPAALNARSWEGGPPKTAVGLAYLGICFNFAAIYFFNALHKGGPSWRDGSTIHWVLWQNRMATSLAAFVRSHEPFWLSPALTWGTLVMEWALPALILLPFGRKYLRAVAVAFVWALHGGIATLCTLGPFSYSMMVTGLVLLQAEHFEVLNAWVATRRRERVVRYRLDEPRQVFWARVLARLDLYRCLRFEAGPRFEVVDGKTVSLAGDGVAAAARALPGGPAYAWACGLSVGALRTLHRWLDGTDVRPPPPERLLPATAWLWSWLKVAAPALLLAAVVGQLWWENWSIRDTFPTRNRPEWIATVIDYLTIPQGWSMFAPDPPHDDGRMVIDATLTDGSHVDLLTGQAPDFEPWKHGPWFFDQHWCEMHARMRGWGQHFRNFRDYLWRTPAREGWRGDLGIADFEVFFVSNRSPAPGELEGTLLEKKRMFGMRDWPLP